MSEPQTMDPRRFGDDDRGLKHAAEAEKRFHTLHDAAQVCSRQSAHAALNGLIGRHLCSAKGLQALLNALPRELPPEADNALWELIVKARQP